MRIHIYLLYKLNSYEVLVFTVLAFSQRMLKQGLKIMSFFFNQRVVSVLMRIHIYLLYKLTSYEVIAVTILFFSQQIFILNF